MSVWVAVPSKRPVEHVAQWAAAWRERGYRVALFIDADDYDCWAAHLDTADLWLAQPYRGYAQAVNTLTKRILHDYPECNWIVTGGDDVYPDPDHTADEIAQQCEGHFYGSRDILLPGPADALLAEQHATFGVMQPTGDRWPSDIDCWADRVCCSPWMGREWCQRINQGHGPLWHEYTHNFVDEELQNVALKYAALWQWRDIVQRHENWSRARKDIRDLPDFLKGVTGPSPEARAHWAKYKALFESRRAAGFPGSEPL